MATTGRPTIERRKARAAPWRPRPCACLRAASWRQTRSCYADAPDLMAARVRKTVNGRAPHIAEDRLRGNHWITPEVNRVRGPYTWAAQRCDALCAANRTSAATILRTHCADAPDEWRMRALRIARCFMSGGSPRLTGPLISARAWQRPKKYLRVIQLHTGRNTTVDPVLDSLRSPVLFIAKQLGNLRRSAQTFDQLCVIHGEDYTPCLSPCQTSRLTTQRLSS